MMNLLAGFISNKMVSHQQQHYCECRVFTLYFVHVGLMKNMFLTMMVNIAFSWFKVENHVAIKQKTK